MALIIYFFMIKKIIFILTILLIITITINNVYGISKYLYIYIDPGHGGIDPGTVVDNIKEKDINLALSLLLQKKLLARNVKVSLTRTGDYDLSSPNATFRKKSDFDNRILLINNSDADMYISIHTNYLEESKYNGIMIYATKDNIELAKYLQKSLNTKRAAKEISDRLYLYKELIKPGVLIECGFLSNEDDRKNLVSEKYLNNLANLITNSIVNYYLNGV